jgi:7 transmembrane sweet-taste receptor of 3 GCPR
MKLERKFRNNEISQKYDISRISAKFRRNFVKFRLAKFLIHPTLNAQVKQINDSRLVGMSIYNVAVLCMITAPVTLVIADQPNASFAFVSLANVFCCFLSMALVFVPKVKKQSNDSLKRILF